MVGKKCKKSVEQKYGIKNLYFSIRKFKFGVASVTIASGLLFLGGVSVASANEISSSNNSLENIIEEKNISYNVEYVDINNNVLFTENKNINLKENKEIIENAVVPKGYKLLDNESNKKTLNLNENVNTIRFVIEKAEDSLETTKFRMANENKKVVNQPNVNHLENKDVVVEVSNFEANTQFDGNKAVDGNLSTRWATDRNANIPTLIAKLPENTYIKQIEIDWDKRTKNGVDDPNVKEWRLSYSPDDSYKNWILAHKKTGEPLLEDKVVLEKGINAKALKLEITDYVAGKLNWKNVGILEFRAYSNVQDENNDKMITNIESISLSEDGNTVKLPDIPDVKLIGTSASGVIDNTGKVYKPLTTQDVNILLEQNINNRVLKKEFTIRVDGLYKNEGVGEKPIVAPNVQQWHGIEGKTTIDKDTVIVANKEFEKAIKLYQRDLVYRGLELNTGDISKKRIEFKKVDDKGYGEEGYGIKINNGVIIIEAQTNKGALYATRTLLQMGEKDLQNGEIRDYPNFSHRGFLLDTGRKFVPVETVIQIIENMAYYKMNDLQLHLNDNYIFLKEHIKNKGLTPEKELEYVLNNASTGFRVETDVVGENGVALTSKEHYTKEEIETIIKYANFYGINLVPEIDTPGHALSFVKVRPDLMYRGTLSKNKHNVERVAMLDLSEKYTETLNFVKSVYEKLFFSDNAPMKDVTTIHIGTDEYYGNTEDYRRYTNDMIKYIKSKGKTPRLWGSLSIKQGKTPVDLKDVELQVWNVGWHRPESALLAGAKVINITDIPTYSVPSGSGSIGAYGDYANYIDQYNRWTPNDFTSGGDKKFEKSNPNIIGGGHAVWNDNIDLHETGITSYDIFKRFFKTMVITSEKTWGSSRIAKNYENRTILTNDKIYSPTSNPEYKISETEKFDISKDTISNYKNENIVSFDELKLTKTSNIETGAYKVGPNAVLSIDITLTGEGEQVFSTDGKNKIYLSDKDGKLAYKFENFHIQFDKQLEKNKRYKIDFVTKELNTDVYVDDMKINRIYQPKHPKLSNTTLILPLSNITGFDGILHNAKLTDKEYINPRIVQPNEILNVSASSEHKTNNSNDGSIELAFDKNNSTIWHTKWGENNLPYTVNINLKQPTKIEGLTYLPRQDSSNNGLINEYEIYADIDGKLTNIFKGSWENNKIEKIAKFTPILTNKIQLKIISGVGNFGSAAEINLIKTLEKHITKIPNSAPTNEEKLEAKITTEKETIPYKTITEEDSTLNYGEQITKTEGQNGEKTIEKVGDDILKETITKQPINKVIKVGTKKEDDKQTEEIKKETKVPSVAPTVEDKPVWEHKVSEIAPIIDDKPIGIIPKETKIPNTFPTLENKPFGKIFKEKEITSENKLSNEYKNKKTNLEVQKEKILPKTGNTTNILNIVFGLIGIIVSLILRKKQINK